MNYSYFPGCTLRTHGKALDTAARLSAAKLGIELRELPQWQCCGGYQQIKDPEHAKTLSGLVLESAGSFGAEMLITACPLCRCNLNRSGDLPVYYFTQLLAQALGVVEETV